VPVPVSAGFEGIFSAEQRQMTDHNPAISRGFRDTSGLWDFVVIL